MSDQIKPGYARITEVISKFSGIEFVPQDILDAAAERGSKVHAHIEAMLQGFELDIEDQAILPYLESFKTFWNGSKQIKGDSGKVLVEQRLYCDKLIITGCIDCIIQTPERTYLFDWKTSSRESNQSWRLQAAAYGYLASTNGYKNVDDLVFVKLDKKGKNPKIFKYDTFGADLLKFQNCLELYRFFDMESTRKKLYY